MQVPSELGEELALHEVHVLGAEQAVQPERHAGTSHRSPLHSGMQVQVQSEPCWPWTHETEHTQVPAASHDPKPLAQVDESQRVAQAGPKKPAWQEEHCVLEVHSTQLAGHGSQEPSDFW